MRRELRILGTAVLLGVGGLALPAAAQDAVVQATQIVEKMAGVADELNQKQTGEPVQVEQKAIVADLDALIASLEKQCQACRNGIKRNNPRQGMPDSMISRGTGGVGALLNPGENGKDWAKLSDRERDRILQSMSEGFPPEYRTVLERYYRRLAEEKPAAATTKAEEAVEPSEQADEP